MVVAAPHNPSGGVPHAQAFPPGPTMTQGIRHTGPGPGPRPGSCRGPNPTQPERQQQPNMPFFYVQPPQPYLPYQWPMPMPYTPYGGFPGFGYGMVLPPFPPASYVDAPGYIVPHTQLHMVDYRRMMTPHMAPTMAYQARRFRYQHTTPSGRVMVSSEVQTELVGTDSQHNSNSTLSSQNTSESGRSSASGSVLLSPKLNENQLPACPDEEAIMSSTKTATEMSGTAASSAVPNSGILFQAEEVRIECSGSPSALKIVHSQETGELARNASGELLQCSMESAEDVVMRCFQSVQFGENDQKKCLEDLGHLDEQYLPPCPDILLMRSCPTNGTTLEGSDEPASSTLLGQGDSSLVKSAEDTCGNPKNIHFKILRLPLELQCLDELHRMEASVWSVESLMPYIPSNEWMMQNGLMTPQKQSLPTVMEVPAEVLLESNSSKQTSAQTSLDKHDGMVVALDDQDSVVSPESIPPCLTSAGWLADFGNVCPNKTPNDHQQVKNQSNWPEGPQQTEVNQNTDVQSSVSPNSAPEKSQEMIGQRVKTSGVVSLSDVEGHSLSCPDVRVKHKVRLCKNCLSRRKTGVAADLSPKSCGMKRHKVADSHLMEDKGKLCGMCRHDPGKKARYKASSSGSGSGSINQYRKSPEVSENAVYPLEAPKKCLNRLYNVQTSPSARHAEKCPTSHQSKLREQNCSCDHLKVPRTNPAWSGDGYGHCSDVTRERNEENLAFSTNNRWRDAEQKNILHQQSDKLWRGNMQLSDTESTKSGGKTRTHKQKQCAQTPEIHRRDTRC